MTKKSGLDAHIVKKYAAISTLSSSGVTVNEPEKIWGTLGALAMMNVATQQIRKVAM